MGEAETSANAGASLLTGPKGEDRAAVASGPGQGMDGKNTGLGYDGWGTLSPWRSHIPSGCQVYEWDKDTDKMWTEFIYDWRL